ncbi:MAG: hypothetical protein CMJ19_01110 [Phycisphaeraceae bacterium]|nr:hypothetical protein [Phycisphaeraceae bacterium]
MSRFSYIAIQRTGERTSGMLRSTSKREVVAKLLELGYHPVVVEAENQQKKDAKESVRSFLGRVKTSDLAVFTRQFAALLKAGLPIMAALETLQRQSTNRYLARTIEDVRASLAQDAPSLADAFAEHPKIFNPVYCGLVRSGEEGGRLIEVLNNLSVHLARMAKLRGQVLGAFVYPIFLLLMGITAVFILMAFVIPKFQKLFTSFGQQLPTPTRFLIAVSDFLSQWWWVVALLLVMFGGMVFASLKKQAIRSKTDALILKLPLFGPMVLKVEAARIARTLGALLKGGVRIVEALNITARTIRNSHIRETFGPMGQAVSTGNELGLAMEQAGVYPPLMVNLIRTGEETGELPEMLEELASIYDDEAERAVNGAVKLLEPVLIVAMGLVIAGIVAAVMLPIFKASAIVS